MEAQPFSVNYKIQRKVTVRPREVWPNEAKDFTTWIAARTDMIQSDLGIALDPDKIELEKATGSNFADMVAHTMDGHTAIIENQLDRSDHDHVGKLVTYTASHDADIAVLICEVAKPEHIAAIEWLNRKGAVQAYIAEIQAIKTGDGTVVPQLILVSGPLDHANRAATCSSDKLKQLARDQYYDIFLPLAAKHTPLPTEWTGAGTANRRAPTGFHGIELEYWLKSHTTSIALRIDNGDAQWNDTVYQHLLANKQQIEETLGAALKGEAKQHARIRKLSNTLSHGGREDPHTWPVAMKATYELMTKLNQAIHPHLKPAVDHANQATQPSHNNSEQD